MMADIDHFKFRVKLASKHVNELVVRRLDSDEQFLIRGGLTQQEFDLFRKVASSDHLQRVYRQAKLETYISPVEFTIRAQVKSIEKHCQFTYTPLVQLCEKYLKNPFLVQKILDEGNQFLPNQGSSYFQRIRGKLQLELYLDEAVIAPSGNFFFEVVYIDCNYNFNCNT